MVRALYNDGMDDAAVTEHFQNVVDNLTKEIDIMVDTKSFPHIVSCEDYQVIKYPDEIYKVFRLVFVG